MATLEELQTRLTRLDDIKEIEKLQSVYGYYRDYSDWQKVVDLFADDDPSVEVADYGVYKGKEGVRRFYVDLLGNGPDTKLRPGHLSIVFQFQGVVTVEPGSKTAKARWYGMGMEARPTVSLHEGELRQTWIAGVYENEYMKEGGKWKIKKLHFNLTFRTPYEEGWLKVPVIGQHGPSLEIPPDEPPTAYYPYPSGYQVPVSFKHPVADE